MLFHRNPALLGIVAAASLTVACLPTAEAQDDGSSGTAGSASSERSDEPDTSVAALAGFDIENYADGFTAEGLLDEDVQGTDGEPIGEVLNIVVGGNGVIDRVIINSDGFLGIGETVISIPFDRLDLTPGTDGVTAAIEEDDTDAYSIFGEGDGNGVSKDSYRVSAMMGDDVVLNDGTDYGYLADLAFDQKGTLQAVIVQPDIAFEADGYYAYPFTGYGVQAYEFTPYASEYTLPYAKGDVEQTDPFDYDEFQENSALAGSG
ncbi:PRC-barrel domain-containing protein [Fulvimarina sp. 2208YS6-2-32]|uniref:PRC-barrel domain-containing protein n=1 Tax=Fulvimarina uroteuthidis TaxID=3098149 RepID=A0ABU5I962_9HYPH|nr:PRC-barrel domain-containing protein [Fulvimarina sp. 2208YS6-2-32]MDY8110811.1 PRC-barrel domain-containing protein [Fulvimarina sp. 2208YS6-2-32]